MKNNIIIFLNAFWNNGNGTTGGDQMLKQIFKRNKNQFNKIYCYTSLDGQKFLQSEIDNAKYITEWTFLYNKNLLINYILRTFKALNSCMVNDINIIYGGSDFFPDVVPAFLYKIIHPKTKWVQCIFHIYPKWNKRQGNKFKNFVGEYSQKISFLLIKKADQIININSQVTKELIRQGFDKNKINLNTPGIDFNHLSSLEIDKTTAKYNATFLGRLHASKGIFDLVKTWQIVTESIPDAKLAIIGGSNEKIKSELISEIIKNNLQNNIDILGHLPDDLPFKLIKNSDVFIFPSHEEGFAIAIAEALACETPIVAWNLPSYKETYGDLTTQVEENNINEFAKATIEILSKSKPSNIAKPTKISKSKPKLDKEFINKYDWDTVSKINLEILNK